MANWAYVDNSKKYLNMVMNQISSNMQEVQAEYASDMHNTLSQEPHGRYWKDAGTPNFKEVPGPGEGVHRSSAPGEPPAVFKGLLRNSIESSVIEMSRTKYKGAVSTKAPYAALLENGGMVKGRNGKVYKIEPRPAWLPTLVHERKKYGKIAAKGFGYKGGI
jgi:hypothetical protein